MKSFIAFLLVLGVVGLASSLNHKSREKRQGYGDLGGGDTDTSAPQPQSPQPTYQPQQPSQPTYQSPQPQQPTYQPQQPSQPTYQSPQPQQPSQPSYQAPQPSSRPTYPQSQTPYQQPGQPTRPIYQPPQTPVRPTPQQTTYGGSGRQYPTGGGQYQTGGGQYQTGGGQHQTDYPDYGDGAGSLPGTPGRDYPTYGPNPPNTNFVCSSVPYVPGYYANIEYGCQVWHICEQGGKLSTFLCPNGTIFNQRYLVCDWWYNVNCGESANYFNINADLYKVPAGGYEGQYKGSGYGNVGGTVVGGGGNSYGGRVPTQGTYQGQNTVGYPGGRGPAPTGSGPTYVGTTSGGGGSGQYPSGSQYSAGGQYPSGGQSPSGGGQYPSGGQSPSGGQYPTSGQASPSYQTTAPPPVGY